MLDQNILTVFEKEHPQIGALLLIMLPVHIAGMILSQVPISMAFELVTRVIKTQNIDIDTLEKITRKLYPQFDIAIERLSIDKYNVILEILLHTDYIRRREIILELRETQSIFLSYPGVLIIEDLPKINPSLLCHIFSKITIDEILTILRITPENIKELIFSCYSEEDVLGIKSNLEWAGAVPLDTIAHTCQKIVTLINNAI
jgi:flagellar motor switch protein FliG